MIPQRMQPFQPVALGQRATVAIPRWDMSICRAELKFKGANALTKTTITEIVGKIGARAFFGPVSGLTLDKIQKYKGIFDQADTLCIDLTERDGLSQLAKEIGAIDLPGLGGDQVFFEVLNNAAAGTPALYGVGYYTGRQFPEGDPNAPYQLIHKLLPYNVPSSGGTSVTWTPDFKGALVKRIFFEYAGTDWTATADGNIQSVEVKKNGIAVWDNIACTDARFFQTAHRKVPQSKVYVVDFMTDNVQSGALATNDARSLEINLKLGSVDTIRAYVELVDRPNNL